MICNNNNNILSDVIFTSVCFILPPLSRTCPAGPWGRLWWTLWTCAAGAEMVGRFYIFQSSQVFMFRCGLNVSRVLCNFPHPGPSQVLQVADALCVQLSSRDLLGSGGDDEDAAKLLVPSSGCQTSSVNPLLISCWISHSCGTFSGSFSSIISLACLHPPKLPSCVSQILKLVRCI